MSKSYKKRGGIRKTHKKMPWSGWPNQKPSVHQKTVMLEKCGRKCFLGPGKSFPVCTKNTCEINPKGVYAAFVRAREWGNPHRTYKGRSMPKYQPDVYKRIQVDAKNILERHGYKNVGKKTRKNRK
jgi:hypothetical protein